MPPNPNDVLTFTVGGKTDWAAVPNPVPFTVTTLIGTVLHAASSTFDIDLTTAAFKDSVTYFKAEVYATTKQNAGAGTANMTAACVILSEAVYDNKNGAITFTTAAAGGAANPMPAQNNEMTLFPQVCDTNLQGGGGASMNAVWSLALGNTVARLTVTNTNALNDALVEIDIYMRRKLA